MFTGKKICTAIAVHSYYGYEIATLALLIWLRQIAKAEHNDRWVKRRRYEQDKASRGRVEYCR